MGGKKDISTKEREDIVNLLSDGKLEIAEKLSRDQPLKKKLKTLARYEN